MQSWFFIFRRWPLWALHAVGHVAGWLVWCASPSYRRRFVANARQAGLGWRQMAAAIGHSGAMSLELPRLWQGPPVPLQWQGEDVLKQAYAQGRGVLFLTPHLGCFEVTAQALASRFGPVHGPLTVLYKPSRQAGLARIMQSARQRPGLKAVPTDMGGVRAMLKALRTGRSVGLLPDQVPPDGMGHWAPFFGKPAYTMTLAARLALQTGASVVLIWGERLPWGQGYRLHASAPAQALRSDVLVAAAQINQEMERLVRGCPAQYMWGYARYKNPPGQPSADAQADTPSEDQP